MVQTPRSIHGGDGIVRVGTTGTVGALMTKELDSLKRIPQTSSSSMKKPQTAPVSVPCGAIPRKSLHRRNSANEASSSGSTSSSSSNNNTSNNSSGNSHRNPGNTQKSKSKSKLQKNDHHIPILRSGEVPAEGKTDEKSEKKGPSIVEVVDLKCGHPDKGWTSPITTRLRKLGFSKLSESVP